MFNGSASEYRNSRKQYSRFVGLWARTRGRVLSFPLLPILACTSLCNQSYDLCMDWGKLNKKKGAQFYLSTLPKHRISLLNSFKNIFHKSIRAEKLLFLFFSSFSSTFSIIKSINCNEKGIYHRGWLFAILINGKYVPWLYNKRIMIKHKAYQILSVPSNAKRTLISFYLIVSYLNLFYLILYLNIYKKIYIFFKLIVINFFNFLIKYKNNLTFSLFQNKNIILIIF